MIVIVVMKLVKGVVRSKRKCSGTVLFVSRGWLMADYSVLLLTSDSLFLLANQLDHSTTCYCYMSRIWRQMEKSV